MHYKQKVAEVEARELTADTVEDIAQWVGGIQVKEMDPVTKEFYVGLNIPTFRGNVRASEGDFVIRSKTGIVSVMKPNEFRSTYEPFEN